jgi:hypothetical protein
MLPWMPRNDVVRTRDFSECPKGANYQWGKDPLE